MKSAELKEFIDYNEEHERYIAIPNSLFTKLLTLTNIKKLKSQHVGFAFSYIYLQTYLFRYTKYEKVIPSAGQVKKILGYSASNKTLDYIVKRKGLLDESKITYTSNDFVLLNGYEDEYLTFTYVSDLCDYDKFRASYKIGLSQSYKVPIFGFYSTPDNFGTDEPYDGTFYQFDDSSETYTLIDFEVFAYMLSNDELGVNAFYLYCYLLHKNNLYPNGYDATSKRLSNEIGMSAKTIERYRDSMRSYNIVKLEHKMEHFIVGLKNVNSMDKLASSNIIHTFEHFADKKITYKKQTLISYKTHKKLKNDENNTYMNNEIIEFDEFQLPF